MWQAIITASVVVAFVRAFPALFKSLERLKEYPRLNKFLDYTICFLTGEVIYTIAFNDIPSGNTFMPHTMISIATIMLAGTLMWFTANLTRSLLLSLGFFTVSYYAIVV
jgi:branched-subunit amino acid transport protein